MKPDRLKIDKDRVLPAPNSSTARDVIRSIVSIASTLKIGVTAEGLETEEPVALMRVNRILTLGQIGAVNVGLTSWPYSILINASRS